MYVPALRARSREKYWERSVFGKFMLFILNAKGIGKV